MVGRRLLLSLQSHGCLLIALVFGVTAMVAVIQIGASKHNAHTPSIKLETLTLTIQPYRSVEVSSFVYDDAHFRLDWQSKDAPLSYRFVAEKSQGGREAVGQGKDDHGTFDRRADHGSLFAFAWHNGTAQKVTLELKAVGEFEYVKQTSTGIVSDD